MRLLILGIAWLWLVCLAANAQVVVQNGSVRESVDCYQRNGHIANTWVDEPPDSIKPFVIFTPHQYEFASKPGRMFAIDYHWVNYCCTDMVHGCTIYLFADEKAIKGKREFDVKAFEAVTASCMGGRWLLPEPFDSVSGSLRLQRKFPGRWKMEVQLEGHYGKDKSMALPHVEAKVRRFPSREARTLKPQKDNYGMI